MITNYIEYLDTVLIREGQVDMKVKLDLTNRDTNTQLFFNIFKYNELEEEKAEEKTLRKLAVDFANKVPEYEFSPAEI